MRWYEMKGQPNRDLNPVPSSHGSNHATDWANEAGALWNCVYALKWQYFLTFDQIVLILPNLKHTWYVAIAVIVQSFEWPWVKGQGHTWPWNVKFQLFTGLFYCHQFGTKINHGNRIWHAKKNLTLTFSSRSQNNLKVIN